MHLTLWIVQVGLALVFAATGTLKVFLPIEQLGSDMPWVLEYSPALVRFIGIAELLGAVGLVLPAATRVKPGLTPLAAAGLAVVMLLAVGFHIMRSEWTSIPLPAGLMVLSLFVAWGRTKRNPIAPRT